MNKKTIYISLLAMLMSTGQVNAQLQEFSLVYSGGAFGNSASAIGLITLDDQITPNPTSDPSFLYLGDGQAITAFSITVSNASSGNGSFGLTDYDFVSWDTAGTTLDWSSQLIGQRTVNGGWGTASDGTVGDFSLFADAASIAPTAAGYFQIDTNNGNGDLLQLVSMQPVPVPGMAWLFTGLTIAMLKRRRGS